MTIDKCPLNFLTLSPDSASHTNPLRKTIKKSVGSPHQKKKNQLSAPHEYNSLQTSVRKLGWGGGEQKETILGIRTPMNFQHCVLVPCEHVTVDAVPPDIPQACPVRRSADRSVRRGLLYGLCYEPIVLSKEAVASKSPLGENSRE